jgi:exopolyphosphatase/guanosine-5'-triphosphate,3'-diphosphate pyrophosphatase
MRFRIVEMRVAVVDVGSNTARVLVADVARGGRLSVLAEKRERLGLGAEIARTGELSRSTVRTVARVCGDYVDLAEELGAVRMRTIVTAPGRQGRSPKRLVRALADATGLPVEVLSADEEGRLAYDGAIARTEHPVAQLIGVVDVGGGSTEIVLGSETLGPAWVRSIDLGSIRLTRQHLHRDPPRGRELAAARDAVRRALAAVSPRRPDVALATGGSARAVAKLVGDVYRADDVEEAIEALARRPSTKVARDAGIHPVRAASLLAGALLLAETARVLRRPLRLAGGGVREGAALALARRPESAAA